MMIFTKVDLNYSVPIGDLFANFSHNWATLWPILALLFGVLAGFFFIKMLMKFNN